MPPPATAATPTARAPRTERAAAASGRTESASARLEARISRDLYAAVRRAAELQDRTVTDFVNVALLEAAQRVIQQSGIVALSLADQERFAGALLAPPRPNAALKRAFARRRKLIESS